MRIIYFEENEKNQWNEFIAENCSESFLQSWEWGEFQKSLGRKAWRIGVVDDNFNRELQKGSTQEQGASAVKVSSIKYQVSSDNLVAVALIIKYNLPFGWSYFYCPRGPVIKKFKVQSSKFKVLDFLFEEVKKIAKKEKSLFLRIDPPAELNNESRIMNYECLFNLKKSLNEIQPRDTLILNLTKSEEELLKEMKQKTRYNIKLAEKKELRITNYELRMDNKKIFRKYFEEFWKLVEETSRRDKFKSHNKDYYWKMLENLGSYNDSGKNCHSEFSSESIDYKSLTCFKFVEQSMERIRNAGGYKQKILKQVQDDKCNCKNKLQAKLYLAEHENKIIAANIILYFGDLAIYLHGASSGEHRNLMAPYLLQWRQILDAKKIGCKKYDFWGIESSQKFIKSKVYKVKSSWSGITRFKKGFGGEEKNYIGAYDAVFDNIGYAVYKFVKSIKEALKN